jgi:hypothetical protein
VGEDIHLSLSKAGLVVLSHWIHQLTERPDFDELAVDPADRAALWALECLLEGESPVIFDPDYAEQLEEARRELRPTEGG